MFILSLGFVHALIVSIPFLDVSGHLYLVPCPKLVLWSFKPYLLLPITLNVHTLLLLPSLGTAPFLYE